jgi:hypothetical protein
MSELNMCLHPGEQMRRWCACTALGRYSQQQIDRYRVWTMPPIRVLGKRQFCCASWHLHKKIKKKVSPCHHNMVISEEWGNCPGRGICFDSFWLLKWWWIRWKMSSDLLASRSNPVAQALKRITHRNVKMFIIFWWYFSLKQFASLL